METAEKLNLTHGDVLVLTSANADLNYELMKGISQTVEQKQLQNVLIISKAAGQSLEVLNEEDMAAHGWHRTIT